MVERTRNKAVKDILNNHILIKFPKRIERINEYLRRSKINNVDYDISIQYISRKTNLDSIDKGSTSMTTENKGNDFKEENLDHQNAISDHQKYLQSNKNVAILIKHFKPHLLSVLMSIDYLKLWLSIIKPKIEDGDNLGVFVHSQLLGNLVNFETSYKQYEPLMEMYYKERGDIVKKILKYPFVENLKSTVDNYDELMIFRLGNGLRDIRNFYSAIYNLYVQNKDKILQCHSSHR